MRYIGPSDDPEGARYLNPVVQHAQMHVPVDVEEVGRGDGSRLGINSRDEGRRGDPGLYYHCATRDCSSSHDAESLQRLFSPVVRPQRGACVAATELMKKHPHGALWRRREAIPGQFQLTREVDAAEEGPP